MENADKNRLRQFNGMADNLFDRNWARRLESEGYLEQVSSDMSGSRYYEITDAGREALAESI